LFDKLIKSSAVSFLILISNASFADMVIEVNAQPDKGFNFPFLLRIPSNIGTNYLIIETNNTGFVSDDLDIHYKSAKKAIKGNTVGPWIAKKLNSPILIPAFPRPKTDWQMH
jgi:hypothetical protein